MTSCIRQLWILVLLAVLLPRPVVSAPAVKVRVVVLGSSTAAGANATPLTSSWANLYAAYLSTVAPGAELTNLAVGGYTTFNVMPTGSVPPAPWAAEQYLPVTTNNITTALALEPSLIIINLPTNDADLHIPVERQMQNYAVIIGAAAARGIPVWVSTPQPRTNGDDIGRALLIAMRAAIVESFQERAIDFWSGLADTNGRILATYDSDGAHLNNAGHALLYQRAVATIALTAPTLPSIAMHPRSCSVAESDSASFSVVAIGTTPPTYRWQRNGADVTGATASRYTITHTTLADSGATYRCIVSSGTVRDTSTAARLSVRKLSIADRDIVSDDFSGTAIDDARWTRVNPLGDATFSLVKPGARDACLAISIPAGTAHDLWTGAFSAPRLLQSARNADMTVEVKFNGSMTAEYQTQGIVAVQDATTLIRFEFIYGNGKMRFFSASFSGGTPTIWKDTTIAGMQPSYLRVRRTGNTWTAFISSNGTAWTTVAIFSTPLIVTAVGPFAGNAGTSPPAFTALVDYFFNASSPIVPEDGGNEDPLPPSITSHPQSLQAKPGDSVAFTVHATGTAPLSYQWHRNNTPIAGATQSIYRIAAVARADSGARFRCVVTNPFGIASSSTALLAVISSSAAFGLVSDAFNSSIMNSSLWRVVNPQGDAVVTMTGTQLRINVPSGSVHDLWPGFFNAPRVLQTVGNADMSVDAKFDAPMSAEYQAEGIIALQDSTTFVRFDFIRDASVTRFFAASFSGTVPTVRKDTVITSQTPLYLRVRREGHIWTASLSYTGRSWKTLTSFTAAITLTAIGPFAGNAGVHPPAFAADVDYFMNTADVTSTGVRGDQPEMEGTPGQVPHAFSLMQNFPNPFNPSTTILYALPAESFVTVRIFNTLGASVATLVDGIRGAGNHRAVFDAGLLCSGVYFCRIEARRVSAVPQGDIGAGMASFTASRKMLLLR